MRGMAIALVFLLASAAAHAEESAWTYLNRGIKAYQKGDFRRAGELFDAATRHDRRCHDAYFYLGMLAEKKREVKKATEYYLKVDASNGMYPLCMERLGHIARVAGDLKKAAEYYAIFAKKRPTTMSWMLLGSTQMDLKKFKEAEVSLTEAGKYSKGNLDLTEMRARLFIETKRPNKALDEYTAILKVIPSDNTARFLRGQCLVDLDRKDEGQREFEQVLKTDPWHAGALHAMVALLDKDPASADEVKEFNRRLKILAKAKPKVRAVSGKRKDSPPPFPGADK